jgi:hypothetical protein
MPSSAALRLQIENALERRFPSALTPVQRTIHEVAATGVAVVDELLEGGLPIGAISEVTGPASSGRTTLLHSFLAQRTRLGQLGAWVDASDAFDPESAAAAGVSLRQLLWIRCQDRHEVRNSPSKPSNSHSELPQPRLSAISTNKQPAKPWSRLDQALRATDLLLQAGGFAAILLDLGDTAPEHASRIPLATWFRFRQGADRCRCSLLVLGRASYAQSSAAVVLECLPLRPDMAGKTVLTGFQFQVSRERQRFSPGSPARRKPPASTWSAKSTWDTENRA